MKAAPKWFCFSAGIIFVITGVAKIWSAFGSASLLQHHDPILDIQFGHLMFIAGVVELVLGGFCLVSKSRTIAITLVTCLAGSLLAYRLGMWWIGWRVACPCLGSLTGALHIPSQLADNAMKGILAYLLIGGYGILFYQWQSKWRGEMQIQSRIGI